MLLSETTIHTDGTLRVYSLLLAAEGVIMENTRTHGTLRVNSLLLAAEGVIEEDIIYARTHTDGTLRIHQQRV